MHPCWPLPKPLGITHIITTRVALPCPEYFRTGTFHLDSYIFGFYQLHFILNMVTSEFATCILICPSPPLNIILSSHSYCRYITTEISQFYFPISENIIGIHLSYLYPIISKHIAAIITFHNYLSTS